MSPCVVFGKLKLRQHVFRAGGQDAPTTLADACALIAHGTACISEYKGKNVLRFSYVLETVYFLFVFSFHLLDISIFRIRSAAHHSYQCNYVFSSTFLTWLDSAFFLCYSNTGLLAECNATLLRSVAALRALPLCVIYLYFTFQHYNIIPSERCSDDTLSKT